MEKNNQFNPKELAELIAKVDAYHKDINKARTELIKIGYLNSLCPTFEDKVKFLAIYGRRHKTDIKTRQMIEEEVRQEREKQPKNTAKLMEKLAKELLELYEKAYKQMLENMRKEQILKASQKAGEAQEKRRVAVSDINYGMGDAKIPEQTASKSRRVMFALAKCFIPKYQKVSSKVISKRKNPTIERVSLETQLNERQKFKKVLPVDARLERYNQSVKQRAMQKASQPQQMQANVSVFSR